MTQKTTALRLGTRGSPLAIAQANKVKLLLENLGHSVEIVVIKSQGDTQTKIPLYEMGIVGVFTRALDDALNDKKIDLAVHSLKDVPTRLHKQIVYGAFLNRENPEDVLIRKVNTIESQSKVEKIVIGTSSLRRAAFWLNKYPEDKIENLRGNIILRIKKLEDNKHWNGAIFAAAGLKRIMPEEDWLSKNLVVENIPWMIPAPGQGCIVVLTHKDNLFVQDLLKKINHKPTQIETHIERMFLRHLEGGCSAPIGAYAKPLNQEEILFKGAVLSENGTEKITLAEKLIIKNLDLQNIGKTLAEQVLNKGGEKLLKKFLKR